MINRIISRSDSFIRHSTLVIGHLSIALLLCFFLPSLGWALPLPQKPTLPFYYATGKVFDTDGKTAVPNRMVLFYKDDLSKTVSTFTDSAGNYRLNAYALYFYQGVDIDLTGATAYKIAVPQVNKAGAEEPIVLTADKGYVEKNLILAQDKGPILAGPTITTSSLPAGTVNVAYSVKLEATGGVPPYVWAIQSGTLPDGLKLASDTGMISGTPTGLGSNFNIKVADNNLNTNIAKLSITINQPAGSGPIINLYALLEGYATKGVAGYSQIPCTVAIEARTGNSVDTATEVAGACNLSLNNGTGTNNGNWITPPPTGQNYYIVIKDILGKFSGNHLPIILKDSVLLSDGQITSLNLSEPLDAAYSLSYTPPNKVEALKTLSGNTKIMRSGSLNDDMTIDVSDYSVWKGAVSTAGNIDSNNSNSVRSDLNGDNKIDVSDYSIWKGTVQSFAPDGIPQTGNHIYVPK